MANLRAPPPEYDEVALSLGGANPIPPSAIPYDASGHLNLAAPAFFDLILIVDPEAGMYVWQRTVVDGLGDLLAGARVEVRRAEDNVLASLFSDLAGAQVKSNPFLADDEGFARFYTAAGAYTITASSGGLERVWENVLLGVRLVDMPPELGAFILSTVAPYIAETIADALEAFLVEHPDGVGGHITASVTGSALPTGWAAAHVSLGHYQLTAPAAPLGKRWVVTANVIANDDRYCNIAEGLTANVVTIQVVDTGSGGVDDDFLFLAELVDD